MRLENQKTIYIHIEIDKDNIFGYFTNNHVILSHPLG